MKPIILASFGLFFALSAFSQDDDLLNMVNGDDKPQLVSATFKSSRIANGHSVETISKKHLNFQIQHRFGQVNEGAYTLWGLDQAYMRLGLEYGITDHLTVGIGRSTNMKMYDGFIKYKIVSQTTKGKGSVPVTMTLLSNMAIDSRTWQAQGVADRTNYFSSRLSFVHQLLIARKFSKKLSLQVSPTYVHRNLVTYADEPNDIWAVGVGGRYKLNGSVCLSGEYFPVLNPYSPKNPPSGYLQRRDCLSFGVDFETGGHVFQLIFSNSRGMIDNQFIPYTTGRWLKGDIFFGFNLIRYFSFDHSKKW